MLRKALSVALAAVFATVLALVVNVAPASAAPSDCFVQTLNFVTGPYVAVDGSYVTRSQGYDVAIGSTGNICDKPYVGMSQQCAKFRVVRFFPPTSSTNPNPVFGGWFTSCTSWQAGASSLSGWIRIGDQYYVEYLMGSGQFGWGYFTAHAAT